ncbi:MAG: 50S ribosomal protein L1 [Fimbriimonadia bacterium]|jgi:large subunit ribosomal protein L1
MIKQERKKLKTKPHSGRYVELTKKVEPDKFLPMSEAIEVVKGLANAKFDETIELAVRLGVDPRKSDQVVRGITNLPHGTGKKRTVAVLARGNHAEEAKAAGASRVGAEDLIEEIQNGFRDFDVLIAHTEMAPLVGKIGRLLGPRTPNKRNGTVTDNVAQAVREITMATRVEYRTEKAGNVHLPIGKVSFTNEQIEENLVAALTALMKAKPAGAKGRYFRSITLSTTMSPGVPVDVVATAKAIGAA